MTTLPVRPAAPAPTRSPDLVSKIMGRVGSRDTGPEKIFRAALRGAGIRSFRACDASLPGKPDIVLPGKGLAIFIDGDFWHGHQYQARGFESQQAQLSGVNNAEYWITKMSRNVALDFKNTSALLNAGWKVLRFWESDVRKSPDNCVAMTLESMNKISERASFGALADRTVTELFAGIGLVRLALQRSGWETVFASCDPK
jgi:DNA mismatch endonuclease (patch repair protein)